MSFLERIVEKQIAAAMARGEFDDLPGKGRPLPGGGEIALAAYDRVLATPEAHARLCS